MRMTLSTEFVCGGSATGYTIRAFAVGCFNEASIDFGAKKRFSTMFEQ